MRLRVKVLRIHNIVLLLDALPNHIHAVVYYFTPLLPVCCVQSDLDDQTGRRNVCHAPLSSFQKYAHDSSWGLLELDAARILSLSRNCAKLLFIRIVTESSSFRYSFMSSAAFQRRVVNSRLPLLRDQGTLGDHAPLKSEMLWHVSSFTWIVLVLADAEWTAWLPSSGRLAAGILQQRHNAQYGKDVCRRRSHHQFSAVSNSLV